MASLNSRALGGRHAARFTVAKAPTRHNLASRSCIECGNIVYPRNRVIDAVRSSGYATLRKRVVASAAAVPADGGSNKSPSPSSGLHKVFDVFTDPACNKKLIALALGQMLCSIATMLHDSYLPVYVQDELGLSNTKIGAVQGLAQFLCQVTKGVSGVVGDILGSQVRVLVFGTFLTFLCKPMFALLGNVHATFGIGMTLYWYFFAKLLDRMSKGIREAPTKAVINELARESGDAPNAAYGLRHSLATTGALIGSSIAAAVFIATGQNYVATFTVATIPPIIALVWLAQSFKEELFSKKAPKEAKAQESDAAPKKPSLPLLQKLRILVGAFQPAYWQAFLVVAVLYFARFDASFVSLRAKEVMSKASIPGLFFLASLMQAVMTAPISKVSGASVATRNNILLAGFGALVLANLAFAFGTTPLAMFAGAGLLGVHMAMTHSVTIAMVASYMPVGEVEGIGRLSGTAVSFTDFLLGFVLAASNGLAGVLSDATRSQGLGNIGCFGGGLAACSAAALLLAVFSRFGELGKDELVVKKAKKGTSD